ncbi:hypothetical protein C8Q80DRAFT_1271698 [Daedaleopsis nitida]|nr:hypothetical protein C8Q80DRAFT_1271698 [Daedaleopsis nitida]
MRPSDDSDDVKLSKEDEVLALGLGASVFRGTIWQGSIAPNSWDSLFFRLRADAATFPRILAPLGAIARGEKTVEGRGQDRTMYLPVVNWCGDQLEGVPEWVDDERKCCEFVRTVVYERSNST